MNLQEMEMLVKDAVNDADLRPEEIPSIDLYMDQITSLVADKLKSGSERFHDRVLTKTMINNYSKDGLISPIKGKKYNKEQILQMLLVYSMKNTLSIGEIGRVLQNVYMGKNYGEEMLQSVYLRFLDIKELERSEIWGMIGDFTERCEFDLEKDEDFFTFLLGLAAWSSYLKNVVQALLEARYPEDIKAEKVRIEKQEKAEAKQQKKEKKEADKNAKKTSDEKEAKKEVATEEESVEEPAK